MGRDGDGTTLAEGLHRYLDANGFGDGSYAQRWVRIELAGLPFVFPNTEGRRRALPLHDLHHVLTGYDTDLRGEAEIGAWEVGSGCGRYAAAWVLDIGAAALGLFIAPRRTYRAFVRGRRCRNFYRSPGSAASLQRPVAAVRGELGLDAATAPSAADRIAFAVFATVGGLSLVLLPLSLPLWVAGLLWPPPPPRTEEAA